MSEHESMPEDSAADRRNEPKVEEVRRYEKPQLRRYDQIDQVRPYGPSEI